MSTTTPSQIAARVEACTRKFAEPSWHTAAWRECCEKWGPMSPAALGCLLALVREAWGMGCAVNVHHSGSAQDWHSVRVFHAGAPRGDLFEGYGAESYVAALEAGTVSDA